MANVDIRLGHKNTAWFTTNSTLVLKDGQMVVCSDGANQGKYKIGDGTTQLSALTFYGGVSVSPAWGSITGTLSNQTDLQTALNGKQNTITTGTTSQYLRGDLSLATFPTNVSSFTNDSGYITSSALSPYLTIANAALTYQPIGSYLTGLTVGSTAIGSGTNTRILYNNAGVLGEYAVTGTGTTVVLSTSPTISTSLTVTTASTTNVIRDLVGTPTSSAIYLNQASPSATNYALGYTNTNEVSLNTPVTGRIRAGGTIVATWYYTDFTINASNGLVIANNSNDGKISMTRASGNTHSLQLSTTGYFMYNNTVGAVRYGVTNAGNFYVGNTSSLATTATDGFLYLPSCAGVPTGVPTAITGKVPIVVDSTNNKAYIYSGGAWVALN